MTDARQSLTVITPNAEMTQAIAFELGVLLPPGTILLLEGNFGSGKTTFVQGLGRGLGIQSIITSPTFTLIDEYLEGRLPLYHIDLYRLETSQVKHLHLNEYWQGIDFPLGVVAIEWAERLNVQLDSYLKITLTPKLSVESDERQINFYAQGHKCEEVVEHLSQLAIIASK